MKKLIATVLRCKMFVARGLHNAWSKVSSSQIMVKKTQDNLRKVVGRKRLDCLRLDVIFVRDSDPLANLTKAMNETI